ncbi:MAG: hypothetical protein F4X09_02505 [Gammaproteobacteria bacterium]|nr:hypothetical protein [Gammaproteobacteria bacterium]
MEVEEQLLRKLKECVSKEDYPHISSDIELRDIPFLENESGFSYGASRFYKFVREDLDVRFYDYDFDKFKTLQELGELIIKKQRRKKKLNDPNKKHIIYSATYLDGREYIGRTSVGIERRKWQHINDAKTGKGGFFQCALRELGKQNFKWEIEAEGNREEIERHEMKLIAERRPAFNSQYIDYEMHDEYKKKEEANRLYRQKQQEYFDKNGKWPELGYMNADFKLFVEAQQEIFEKLT